MKAHANSFDFLLNTIPVSHDTNTYMQLLKRDATMCTVGVITELDPPLMGSSVIFGRKHVTGSAIGGMAETREMMDFCAEHNIVSDVEVIDIKTVNEARRAWRRTMCVTASSSTWQRWRHNRVCQPHRAMHEGRPAGSPVATVKNMDILTSLHGRIHGVSRRLPDGRPARSNRNAAFSDQPRRISKRTA